MEMMIRCKETSSKRVISECEQISEGDLTSVAQISCTACNSTAALLQTATSILTLLRPLLLARYLSGLCFSGEHER